MIKLIIFDFDGTLFDTRKIILRIIQEELPNLGYTPTKKFVHSLGRMPLSKSLAILTNDKEELSEIQKSLRSKLDKGAEEFNPTLGFYELQNLPQKKIILSNSISSLIKNTLSKFKANFFSEIYASDEFNNKTEKFIEIIKKENLKKEEIIYLGDMSDDASLAKEVGCKSVIVFGPASWDALPEILKSRPDFIINNLNELSKIVN
jgi:phosphoglycolate phosphatase